MRRALILLLFVLPGLSNFLFAQNSIPYYGIQTHFGQGRADLDSVLLLIKEAGIGAIRDEVYWGDVETVRDTFKFKPEHDAYVQGALAKGLKPLIILDYGNDLYGGTPRDSARPLLAATHNLASSITKSGMNRTFASPDSVHGIPDRILPSIWNC